MSKTVDERVVEMRFDNKNFEQNVSTTMSTLDKLKQKLNFKGASSGLEDISSAAKKVDMNGLANGVETVRAKFSALDVMGVTALANITNQAINAGKRIASALTVDPVKTGLSEYETKMNAIQVIKANTRGKNTMEDITAALDDLNNYADKTIYNFAQMTSNIGKFTAQGLDVNQAKEAVKGMANLAAASGASAEDMARATYQMSQALGGTIKMIDWNSLRNANMATTELKNTLIDVAKVHGVAIDEMIAEEGTFEQTLSKGWLSGEMFTEAMNIYSGVYSDAELKAKGFTDSQIANFKELAAMAESAATEVKTFTQLWDVLKETAQSGWTQTWELIFGGFEEAKSMFTNLQKYFSDIINGWSDARNTLLSGALKPLETWNKIKDKLADSGLGKIKEVAETVGDVTDKLEYFQKIVDKVWRGDYNNSDTGRFELLEKAGYDHRVVQDLVNKGYGYKLTIEDIEASHKKFGLTLDKTSGATKEASAEFSSLSDEQLKNAGLTDAEVRLYRDLEKEARRTGKTIQEVVDEMSKKDGRAMLIESVKNAWNGFLTIITSVKNAFADIFPPMTVVQLYRIIEAINKFSQKMVVGEDTAKKLTRTFKGLFAVIDIVTTVFGGGFKLAFKILTQILSAFDMDVLDLTANIGDAIVNFRDWIDSTLDFTKVFEDLAPYVSDFVGWLKRMIKDLKEMKIIGKIASSIKKLWSALKKITKIDLGSIDFTAIFTKIKDSFGSAIPQEMREFGRNIIEGIQNGLWDKITDVWNTMVSICKRIAEAVTEFFGIHSPATKGIEWGISIIMGVTVGIINGVKFCIKYIIEAIHTLGDKIGEYFEKIEVTSIADKLANGFNKIKEALKGFDWSKLLYIIPLGVVIYVVKQLHDLVSAFTDGIGSINEVIGGFADIEKSISKKIKTDAFNTMADGLKKIATSIAILVGSIYVLSKIPTDKLYTSVAIIFTLAITLTIMATAMRKLQAASATIGKDGLKIAGLKTGLLTIGAAMLLLSATVKLASTMKPEEAKQGFIGLTAICGALLIFVGALRLIVMGKSAIRVSVVAKSLTSIAIAMMLMVGICKLASKLSLDELKQAGVFAGAFLAFVGILVKVTTIGSKKKIAEVSGLLKSIAGSMLLMVLVCKLAGKLEPIDMAAGAGFMVAFLVFIGFLVRLVQMSPRRKIAEISKILLAISTSMLLMTLVCKLAANLDPIGIGIGAGFMVAFLGFVWALTRITTITNEQKTAKIAATLVAMSVAVAVLSGIAILLGLVPTEQLAKGVAAVVLLSLGMAAMAAAAKGAEKCIGNIIALSIAVGVMAAAVAVLAMLTESDKLSGAVRAMTIMMLLFGILEMAAQKAEKATWTILAMAAVVGVLGGVLYLISDVPAEESIGYSFAISMAMLAFAGALQIISGLQAPSWQAIATIVVMTLVVAALGEILHRLRDIDPWQGIGVVGIITVFLGVLYLAIMGTQILQEPSFAALGALAIVTALVVVLAEVLYKLQGIDPSQAIGVVTAIGIFLLVMEGVCFIASAIGAVAGTAIVGLLVLVGFITALGLVIIGLASLAMDVVSRMPKLGADLSAFMENVQPFIDGIQNIPDDISDKIGKLSAAIIKLAGTEIIDAIANFFSGGNTLADLGKELKTFGDGMAVFSSSVGNIDTAVNSISKVKDIEDAIVGVDLSGLSEIGNALKGYSVKVGGLNLQAIDMSIAIARRLATLATSLIVVDYSGIAKFNVAPVAKSLKSYSNAVTGVNHSSVVASIATAGRVKNFINSLKSLDSSGVAGFKSAVQQLGTISIDPIVNSFKRGSVELNSVGKQLIDAVAEGMQSGRANIMKTTVDTIAAVFRAIALKTGQFANAGKKLVTALSDGMKSGKGVAVGAIGSVLRGATNAARGYYQSFHSTGAYLVSGFAAGISANSYKAAAKARAMAKAAADAAEDELDINSPSKVFRKIGTSIPEGFAMGIDKLKGVVVHSATSMATASVDGVRDAISNIAALINSDIDAQPTIRPVVDLSNVRAGAGAISSMFGTPIAATATVGAINSMMNYRNQNGVNSDVVSAIDKLRKDLSENSGGNTYSINGITYDDGSNVSDAIKTLIRAAKIERRV